MIRGELTYDELLDHIRLLSIEQQVSLPRQLEALVRIRGHSIRELRGLGKETWVGINVEKYIEEEHSSWEKE